MHGRQGRGYPGDEKAAPVREKRFLVRRIGMDFKIECCKCGHQIMLPRSKAEKNIKKIIREEH